MAHIRDDGVFDAPLQTIWECLQSPQDHTHGAFAVSKVLDQKGNALVMEVNVRDPPSGTSRMETVRRMMDPPRGFDVVYLEGPSKGTRHRHTYTPLGDKTRVEVEGDFRMHGRDDSEIRKSVLAYFDEVFHEDNAALQRFK